MSNLRGALQADSLAGAAQRERQRKAGTYVRPLNADGSYDRLAGAMRADSDAYYQRQKTKPRYCYEAGGKSVTGKGCGQRTGTGSYGTELCWRHTEKRKTK